MFFFTADPHMSFKYIIDFAYENNLKEDDTIVILGDSCFNHFLDARDGQLKKNVSESISCRLLNLRGNHDARPENIDSYGKANVFASEILFEPEYPNLLFLKDGQRYDFDGVSVFTIGGAVTNMPEQHIAEGHPVFDDEILNASERERVEWS